MRKAQFEIMGLAIVMVIVALGAFLIFSLNLSGVDRDPAGQFIDDQFTRRVLDTFLASTHPTCISNTIRQYYVNYATGRPGLCAQEITEDELHEPLEQAIEKYLGRSYRFEVRENVCEDVFEVTNRCDHLVEPRGECDPETNSEARAARFSLPKAPYGGGSVDVWLWLCEEQ